MNKSDLINKRKLEKMNNTKMQKAFCPFPLSFYSESKISNKCRSCKKFNSCKSEKTIACSSYVSWED